MVRQVGGAIIVAGVLTCVCSVVLWLAGKLTQEESDSAAAYGLVAILVGAAIYGVGLSLERASGDSEEAEGDAE